MIASALRVEMDRFHTRVTEHAAYGTSFAPCAATMQRITRGMPIDGTQQTLTSVQTLSALVEHAAVGCPALLSAYRAFGDHIVTRAGLDDCREEVEQALEAVDDLVVDPQDLPPLRQQFLRFIECFEQFCQEVTSDPERRTELRVSAA